ncbi:MAG: hypothetical protein WCE44_14685 [Candidatus Velthaea sp.]
MTPFLLALSSGVLDQMVADMSASGSRYEAASYALGLGLFAVLSLAGAALYYWRYQDANGGSLHGAEAGLFAMVKALAIPFVIMVAVGGMLPAAISYGTTLGGDITGVAITGPTSIATLGIKLALSLVKQPVAAFQTSLGAAAGNTGLLGSLPGVQASANAVAFAQNSGHMAAAAISTLIAVVIDILVVLPAFALIAFEYILAVANVVLVLSIGAYQMGWSAAPGTTPKAEGYYGAVEGALLRFIVIVVVVSFIGATVGLWGTYLASTDLSQLLVGWFKVIIGSIVCALLAATLPSLAENKFSGRPVLTASGAISGAAYLLRGRA